MKRIPSFESPTPKYSLRVWLALAPVVALVAVGGRFLRENALPIKTLGKSYKRQLLGQCVA